MSKNPNTPARLRAKLKVLNNNIRKANKLIALQNAIVLKEEELYQQLKFLKDR